MEYLTLRDANEARGIEWSNGAKDGPLFYAVELFGEAGELANVVKKLERERLGMVGSRASEKDLADELADFVICLDLLAISYGLGTLPFACNPASEITTPLFRVVSLGRICGHIMAAVQTDEITKACGRTADGRELRLALAEAGGEAFALARQCDVAIRDAVISKFNETSAKYGLTTVLSVDARIA